MNEINIRIANFDLYDEFLSIMGLGLLQCIKDNIIDYDIAWDWLFNIRNQDILKQFKQSKQVKKAIGLATELHTAKLVLSDRDYEKSITDIETIFKKHIVKNLSEKPELERGIFVYEKKDLGY